MKKAKENDVLASKNIINISNGKISIPAKDMLIRILLNDKS
jgi:hypothetical protein